ncbi:hypothetical protein A8F94_08395 [Bacillus sp. FJAT-27225]|uniref:AAA family ATPase n=1 Tax=Bacillus sp. FJAT-27225 TaxID=1743144 RepID=UPI00080C2430|nr:AAA family ATPase [Bacillus sp. FJAT-27225]OCA87849.1 hypothetical protein A8F94_08395 [Bacillus sp. FJAT-27225]
MENEGQKSTIYLISGPVGVGKSTTSLTLAQTLKNCVLIEGDNILKMLEYGAETEWEDRLRITWDNILSITRNFLVNGYNIVIDFVVEEELEWFCRNLSDLPVTLNYVVLTAEKEQLFERIRMRGDSDSIERSLCLLNKLTSTPSNRPFLLKTTYKSTAEIVETIMNGRDFKVIV